jgi:hypothetical protein
MRVKYQSELQIAEQMKKEVETKIEQTKRRMDGLQRKLKLIPNE